MVKKIFLDPNGFPNPHMRVFSGPYIASSSYVFQCNTEKQNYVSSMTIWEVVKYVWWRKANIFHVKEQTLCLLDTPRYICEVSGGSHNPLIHIPFCCVSCTDSCIQHLYILYILLYYAKVLETYSKFNLAWNHFITLNFFAYFNHKPDCLLF